MCRVGVRLPIPTYYRRTSMHPHFQPHLPMGLEVVVRGGAAIVCGGG